MVRLESQEGCFAGEGTNENEVLQSTSRFLHNSNSAFFLQQRSTFLTLLGFTGNLLISTPFLLLQSFPFPCFLILWSLYLGVTFTIFSLSARAWRLRYLFRSNQAKLRRMRSLEGGTGKPGEMTAEVREISDSESEEEGDEVGVWPVGNAGGRRRDMNSSGGGQSTNVSGVLPTLPRPLMSGGNLNMSSRTIVGRLGMQQQRGSPGVSQQQVPNTSQTTTSEDVKVASAAEQTQVQPSTRPGSPSRPPKKPSLTPATEKEPTRRLVYLLLITTTLVTGYITTVTALSKQYTVNPISYDCTMGTWEMVPILVIMASFFMLGCPALVWWLWSDNDTYGIRRDLIVFAGVGTGVAVM